MFLCLVSTSICARPRANNDKRCSHLWRRAFKPGQGARCKVKHAGFARPRRSLLCTMYISCTGDRIAPHVKTLGLSGSRTSSSDLPLTLVLVKMGSSRDMVNMAMALWWRRIDKDFEICIRVEEVPQWHSHSGHSGEGSMACFGLQHKHRKLHIDASGKTLG